MHHIINIIGEKVKSKLARERYGLKITLGQNINTGNLITYVVESEEYWNMVDGFVRRILETKAEEPRSLKLIWP